MRISYESETDRGVLTNASELGVPLGDTGLLEERDEGLVGGLDQHELQGIAVEGDAFEGAQDGVEHGTASNYEK